METSELKQWIRKAREAVQGEPDPYKLEAFKVILSRLIEQASIRDILPEGAVRKRPSQVGRTKVVTSRIPDNVLQKLPNMTNKEKIQILLYFSGKALAKEEIKEETLDLGVDEGWWNGSNFKRDLMKRNKLVVEEKDSQGVARYRLSNIARLATKSLLNKLLKP
ncbi:MAG: hypothetical protein ACE5J2_06925 [Nitrososphaerales archaeon]